MTDVLVKPAFQSAVADSGDATKLGPNAWNAARVFSAGVLGDLVFRDTGSATGASYLPDVAVGQVLASGGVGAAPAWTATPSLTSLTLATPLAATSGGIGFGSFAVGDLLYASTTSALSKLADVAVGQALVSGGVGVAPAWSATPTLTSLQVGAGAAATPSLIVGAAGYGLYSSTGSQFTAICANGFAVALADAAAIAFRPSNDNAWNLGRSDVRWKTGFFGTSVVCSGGNGQSINTLKQLTELTTIAAAASTDTTIQLPANAVILAVTVRTTTVIPTATSYSVGDSGSATRFNTANVDVAANSTDAGTKAGAYYNATALSVRLTMNGGTPAANTGRVRVTIFYYDVTPATS